VADGRAEPHARLPQGDEGNQGHGQDTAGGAEPQDEAFGGREGEAGPPAARRAVHRPEQAHGGDDDHVVRHRCEGGGREPALAVQQPRGDRPNRVEQDLREEEQEQERPELDLLAADGRIGDRHGEEAHDPRPQQQAHDGHGAQPDEGEAQHAAGQALGVVAAAGVEEADERRHQHRRQQAGGQQLEQHVRDQVRRLVGVAGERGAQHQPNGEHPQEPGNPRGKVAGGDGCRRRPEPGLGAFVRQACVARTPRQACVARTPWPACVARTPWNACVARTLWQVCPGHGSTAGSSRWAPGPTP
jgi:hypothetical protein